MTPSLTSATQIDADALAAADRSVPDQVENLKVAAAADARKCMNAVKTVGEALKWAQSTSSHPGDHAARFQKILDDASKTAHGLMVRWGINPDDRNNRWVSNALEKSVLPIVGDSAGVPSGEVLDVWADSVLSRQVERPLNDAWSQDPIITITIFKGLAALRSEQMVYDFGRKQKDDDLELVRDRVIDSAVQAMAELCPGLAPTPERTTFLSMLLEQGFDLMVVSWRKNSYQASQALAGANQAQLKAWRVANPEGFPLDPVLQQFEQNMGRLVRLTLAARKADRAGKKSTGR